MNKPTYISADNDYSSEESEESLKPHDNYNTPLDSFADMEMMKIEISTGGMKDVVHVHWGDDPKELAQAFVDKHKLKASSVLNIAKHIDATVENFKNSNSHIAMQSPSLDDRDDTEERNEYNALTQLQQNKRDSSIQESMQHEPLDLPVDDQHTTSSDGSTSQKVAKHSQSRDTHSTATDEKDATSESSKASLDKLSTPFVVNDTNVLSVEYETKCSQSQEVEVSEQDQNSSPTKDSTFFTVDDDSSHISDGLKHTLTNINQTNMTFEDHGVAPTKSPEMSNLNISPIKRGNTVASLFPSSSNTESSTPQKANNSFSTGHQPRNEKRDSTGSNSSRLSTRKPQPKSTPPVTPQISHNRSPSPVGKSSAEIYNKLKSEWGSSSGRRKSINMNTSTGCWGKEQRQLSTIGGIKQRATLVVSKPVGGIMHGSSIRQPTSGDSSVGSQPPSSPKKNRLYDDAISQTKRRDMLRLKAEKEEKSHMDEHTYRMTSKSRKISSKMIRKNDHLPVGDRLHKEAAVSLKKREENSKVWLLKKEESLKDWSCLQCGTFNLVKVSHTAFSTTDPASEIFTCSSCQSTFNLADLKGAMFHPTNIACMNGTMNEMNSRRSTSSGENIHDYLHANIYLETKKLQLLKESWEDEDEVLTFKPIIPESSKQLLRRYQKNSKYNKRHDSNENFDDTQTPHVNLGLSEYDECDKSKLIVAETGLQSYLSLPPTERLSKAETLCRVAKPGQSPNRHSKRNPNVNNHDLRGGINREKSVKAKVLTEEKMDNLFNRLTYEYIDKETKRELARKELEKFNSFGKENFQPTIGVVPSNMYTSHPVISSDKKETFYDKLLRKGAEAKERAKLLRAKVLKKEKNDIEKNSSQPLPRSKEILEESSKQCVEEIFKILLANQEFFHKNIVPSSGEGSQDGVLSKEKIKLTAEYLSDVSERLGSFKNLSLDIRTIDPNLVVEDVQELLSDLRSLGLENAKELLRVSDEKGDSSDSDLCYFVSFQQFQNMIKQCTAKRAGGVGRSYIYTPKPRDVAVQEMLAEESKECTFHPTIVSKSTELAKNRGRGEFPIDTILKDEAYMKEQRMQQFKSLVEYDKYKECTFKPTLYVAPKSIIPTYRGQPREALPEVVITDSLDFDENNDDLSVMTSSTCSTTVKPQNSTVNAPLVMKNKKPNLRADKDGAPDVEAANISRIFLEAEENKQSSFEGVNSS